MKKNDRSADSVSLENRLNINEKYSRNDFHVWLQNYLGKISFHDVLDVGCGTGKQTLWFLDHVTKGGTVCALDISKESIKQLSASLSNNKAAEIRVGSMDELGNVIIRDFSVKKFDLVHSTFSLYYAKDPRLTLQDALMALKDEGTLAISGPHLVNTLLTFLSRYQDIPQNSWDCLEFINDVVLSFCHKHFKRIETHLFVNNTFITDVKDFETYYKSCTFFNKKMEKTILKNVGDIINASGVFHIQKNSKIVIANNKL
jgi:ubiquinone/menaquinone biosynthesis C-methylase UbiE